MISCWLEYCRFLLISLILGIPFTSVTSSVCKSTITPLDLRLSEIPLLWHWRLLVTTVLANFSSLTSPTLHASLLLNKLAYQQVNVDHFFFYPQVSAMVISPLYFLLASLPWFHIEYVVNNLYPDYINFFDSSNIYQEVIICLGWIKDCIPVFSLLFLLC